MEIKVIHRNRPSEKTFENVDRVLTAILKKRKIEEKKNKAKEKENPN